MNAVLDFKKNQLIQQISSIKNGIVLDRISFLISKEVENELLEEISIKEKKSIEKGLIDSQNGNLISHTKIKASYAKWL